MNRISSKNPSLNYEMIGEVAATDTKKLPKMIVWAKEAQILWEGFSLSERKKILGEVLKLFHSKKEILAKSISQEMGMPITQAREEVEYGFLYFQGYLDMAEKALAPLVTKETETELHTVYYEARGVVAAIAPWNYPFSMSIWTCIQPILAGNAVIFKTSKEVIFTGKLIAEIFESSSLPKGVFQEILGSGSLGDELLDQDINMVTFTGSTTVGRHVYQKAAEKLIPCVMELGGSAPGIVCEDADIDTVLETIYFLRYSNAGQMCDGLKRLIVHANRYDELVQKLSALLESKKLGAATDEITDIGPLVSQHQKEAFQEQYEDALKKGATILAQIPVPKNREGAYVAPTLLGNITHDMRVWREEVFGPLLPVVTFESIEEAIELGNDTDYGLGGYVFTENRETFQKIAKALKTGEVQHNSLNYCIPENPFGGYKYSGIGREHGHWGFHEFCNIKVISQEK